MSSIFNILDLKCLGVSFRMKKYRNVTVTQVRSKAGDTDFGIVGVWE